MFDNSVMIAVNAVAARQGPEPASLAAVTFVESGGQLGARINGVTVPLIRIEGHYFYKLLTADKRAEAVKLGLAAPVPGRVKNPASQEARYRLLQDMTAIDQDAAIMSCSWGVGQVMGVHWKALGFASALAFRDFVMLSVRNQIELMVRFISFSGLADELQRKDWAGFARGYNGPSYRDNQYDQKLAAAYAEFGGLHTQSPAAGMLRLGSRGAGVREIQTLLVRAGYTVTVDGDFGPATRDSLKAFQQTRNLVTDGVAGPNTVQALKAYQINPAEQPGALPMMQVSEINGAVKAVGPLAIVTAARDQLAGAAAQLTGTGSGFASSIANWMLAGAAVASLCLTAYAFYGWVRSKRTFEQ